MFREIYRLKDLQCQVDRNKTTLIRWEKEGLIPKAQRDSRGWRFYTKEEATKIIEMILSSNYFSQATG